MKSGQKTGSATLLDYKERILRVLVHIHQHLDEELSLADLSSVACFSPFHFHRVFKGMVGETVKELVRRLRLERAAIQLRQAPQPVIEVAMNAGYGAHESFTRAFKSAYASSPTQFRARTRAVATLAAPSHVHYRVYTPVSDFKIFHRGSKSMEVTIKTIEPMCVAHMRHIGPYMTVSETWNKFMPWMGKEGFLGGNVQCIGICHDDPDVTPPEKIRYDACVTVDDSFKPRGEIGVQTIPGGDYAVTTHSGPYSKLNETYCEFLGQWLPRSGRELRNIPLFEVYVNDPETTDPQDLLTDVYVPLEPLGNSTRRKGRK